MEFPILALTGQDESRAWVEQHFHPNGLKCPQCGAGIEEGRGFRQTRRSQLKGYRCRWGQTYNFYTGTVFAQHHLSPAQVVFLMRGGLQGETNHALSPGLGIGYEGTLTMR